MKEEGKHKQYPFGNHSKEMLLSFLFVIEEKVMRNRRSVSPETKRNESMLLQKGTSDISKDVKEQIMTERFVTHQRLEGLHRLLTNSLQENKSTLSEIWDGCWLFLRMSHVKAEYLPNLVKQLCFDIYHRTPYRHVSNQNFSYVLFLCPLWKLTLTTGFAFAAITTFVYPSAQPMFDFIMKLLQ